MVKKFQFFPLRSQLTKDNCKMKKKIYSEEKCCIYLKNVTQQTNRSHLKMAMVSINNFRHGKTQIREVC